jgi:hypothetical protein
MGKTARWRTNERVCQEEGVDRQMGERGSNEDMKNRRTNLDAVVPQAEKPDPDKAEAQTAMGRPGTPHKPEVRLGREVQARIGQQLRAMYDDVVNQGVPQHISELIRKLGEQE